MARTHKARVQCTPELAKRIADYIREGHAPDWIGVTLRCVTGQTIRNWIQRGEADPAGPYGELARMVEKARDPRGYAERHSAGGALPPGYAIRKRGGHKRDGYVNPMKQPEVVDPVAAAAAPVFAGEYTDEIGAAIVAGVNGGLHVDIAANVCGVSRAQVFSWYAHGKREPEGRFGKFAADLLRANATGQKTFVDRLVQLALDPAGDPKTIFVALKMLLQTRYAEQWAESMSKDANQVIAAIMGVVQQHVSPDQYGSILQGLRGVAGAGISAGAAEHVAGYLPVAQ